MREVQIYVFFIEVRDKNWWEPRRYFMLSLPRGSDTLLYSTMSSCIKVFAFVSFGCDTLGEE